MNISVTWDDKELAYGLEGLKESVNDSLSGAGCRLNEAGRVAWRKAIASESVLSKGRNGKEWFSFNKKTWYMTNKWRVPDVAWSGRNFIKQKRKQANSMMGRILGQKKQEELDKALEEAIAKFQ
ncbi:MAG: hypothetical protein EBR82_21940 [Caulobacteraceae bacterium]|nr:hypothetical protein [Caulobacteraceae bacterium]